eukprot:m.142468 g.142468  ORF g.142468 m.142468 type:complete len:645 (+) comp16714_c0_seq1:98-2032(+)
MPKPGVVDVPLEGFISLSVETIINSLSNSLPNEEDARLFRFICKRIGDLYLVRAHERTEGLRQSLQLFMPAIATKRILNVKSVSEEEDVFLDRLHEELTRSNFSLLKQSEYDDACNTEYLLSLTLAMEKHKLDNAFIGRFLRRHITKGDVVDVAEVNRHVLIYKRGVGLDKSVGLFITEKIDVISQQLLSAVGRALLYLPRRFFGRRAGKSAEDDEKDENVRTRPVPRVGLDLLLNQSWKNCFHKLEICEPTFKQLILVYRTSEAARRAVTGEDNIYADVTLKSFKDLPMADFEIVLPMQAPQTRPFDVIQLILAVIITIVYVYLEAQSSTRVRTGNMWEDLQSSMPVITVALSYIAKLVVQWQSNKAAYISMMTEYLYHKSMNTDDGVANQIVAASHEQDWKEAILAYYFLWQCHEGSLNSQELDETIEAYLAKLGDQADFEIDDALRKLSHDGLLQMSTHVLNPVTRLAAVDPYVAIERLNMLWDCHVTKEDLPRMPLLELPDSSQPMRARSASNKLLGKLAFIRGRKHKDKDSAPHSETASAVNVPVTGGNVTAAAPAGPAASRNLNGSNRTSTSSLPLSPAAGAGYGNGGVSKAPAFATVEELQAASANGVDGGAGAGSGRPRTASFEKALRNSKFGLNR